MNPAEHEHAGSGGQLRWHPFLRQWVAVAAYRQNRPQMPKDWCPFDPGSGRVPDHYDVYLYPNDFPAFSEEAEPFSPETGLYATTGARGACDVVLYSPDHNKLPSELTPEQWRKVTALWTDRTRQLFEQPDIRYVAVFENTGEAIGVTMPHPHGQIYAFPFVPPQVETEFESARDHFASARECLYCKVLAEELRRPTRLVAVNGSFASFVPFYGRFPSEIHIYARRHAANLMDLSEQEQTDLASMLKRGAAEVRQPVRLREGAQTPAADDAGAPGPGEGERALVSLPHRVPAHPAQRDQAEISGVGGERLRHLPERHASRRAGRNPAPDGAGGNVVKKAFRLRPLALC